MHVNDCTDGLEVALIFVLGSLLIRNNEALKARMLNWVFGVQEVHHNVESVLEVTSVFEGGDTLVRQLVVNSVVYPTLEKDSDAIDARSYDDKNDNQTQFRQFEQVDKKHSNECCGLQNFQ